jgi:hypothetical protein
MSRTVGFVMLAVGIILLIMGIVATQKTGEQVMSGVTGHFTRETMWYIFGGVALILVGARSSFRKR